MALLQNHHYFHRWSGDCRDCGGVALPLQIEGGDGLSRLWIGTGFASTDAGFPGCAGYVGSEEPYQGFGLPEKIPGA